jgi:hypothetical protein
MKAVFAAFKLMQIIGCFVDAFDWFSNNHIAGARIRGAYLLAKFKSKWNSLLYMIKQSPDYNNHHMIKSGRTDRTKHGTSCRSSRLSIITEACPVANLGRRVFQCS